MGKKVPDASINDSPNRNNSLVFHELRIHKEEAEEIQLSAYRDIMRTYGLEVGQLGNQARGTGKAE